MRRGTLLPAIAVALVEAAGAVRIVASSGSVAVNSAPNGRVVVEVDDGNLRVESPIAGGTRVVAEIPLESK